MAFVTPTVQTERLLLRPFREGDSEEIWALQSDPYVLRYWDSPPWTDRSAIARFMRRSAEIADEESGVRVAVIRRSDHAFVGWCAFNSWNPEFRSGSLGYCFKQQEWGQGYATESGRALLEWMFVNTDINRVQSEADTRNPGSARVLEKLGFLLEGTLREDCIVNGDISDSWVYGLLRRDWNDRRLGHS